MNPLKQRDFMKAILLTLITATLFYTAFQADKIKVTGVFQGNVFDQLDPSWPKLA
jgi:hypothetical protein